ncbi:YdcF family protein [Nocardia sp. CDC160]|uniref:YdcF family protein n=1 Tax=Nocardia sp. CDC160 TaxID=3112166 RepID=UPI002DBCC516|nr:YdcF family protein [Nocardia sp. CDC160]MEC3916359.1 YdcF family protein [Nocardia sp. CDC160]
MPTTKLPAEYRSAVEILWDYNQLHHEPRPVDVGIGLGGHDFGVATYTADLYHAVHFRERAIELGVPTEAILVEPNATNTGDNIDFTRALLTEHGYLDSIKSVMLISRPYQQRRSYAICRKRWPEVDVICGSLPLALDDYVESIGDVDRVIKMLVGDTQRIWVYPTKGWAIEQEVPRIVQDAYRRLVDAGFTRRLLPE